MSMYPPPRCFPTSRSRPVRSCVLFKLADTADTVRVFSTAGHHQCAMRSARRGWPLAYRHSDRARLSPQWPRYPVAATRRSPVAATLHSPERPSETTLASRSLAFRWPSSPLAFRCWRSPRGRSRGRRCAAAGTPVPPRECAGCWWSSCRRWLAGVRTDCCRARAPSGRPPRATCEPRPACTGRPRGAAAGSTCFSGGTPGRTGSCGHRE